jgi:tRNA dimethylallyltransferase
MRNPGPTKGDGDPFRVMTSRIDPSLLSRCLVLAGPTACGKTQLALEWAERIGGEIVAMDSMSLYRGMDIGTAKPTSEQQQRVRHHLLDVIAPHQEYSLADYVVASSKVCATIVGADRVPIFVGGTGLYLRGVLRGVFDGPAADWPLREQLAADAAGQEAGWLWSQLQQVDPVSAARLHPNDTRRLVRALEVHALTGRPLSEQQDEGPGPRETRPRRVLWLSPPRDWLYARIDARVVRMCEDGLVEEVKDLLAEDPPPGRTARQALGYKEIIDHLEGRMTLAEAIDTIQRHTRRFARKQTTWFRNLEECDEVPVSGEEDVAELVGRLQDM